MLRHRWVTLVFCALFAALVAPAAADPKPDTKPDTDNNKQALWRTLQ